MRVACPTETVPVASGYVMAIMDRITSFIATARRWIAGHLVADARDWWRWWSLRLMALAAIIQSMTFWPPELTLMLWNMVPEDLRWLLPPVAVHAISLLLLIAAIAGRMVKQPRSPGS